MTFEKSDRFRALISGEVRHRVAFKDEPLLTFTNTMS